jgi:hypothetical protein
VGLLAAPMMLGQCEPACVSTPVPPTITAPLPPVETRPALTLPPPSGDPPRQVFTEFGTPHCASSGGVTVEITVTWVASGPLEHSDLRLYIEDEDPVSAYVGPADRSYTFDVNLVDTVPGDTPEVVAQVSMFSVHGLGATFESAPADLALPSC